MDLSQTFLLLIKISLVFTFIRFFYTFSLSRIYSIKYELTKKINIRFKRNFKPFVSVLIPAWNEEVGIKKTITSILHNTYKNIEIIIVNDGSTDRTKEIVNSIINKHKKRKIELINQRNAKKAAALNNGIKKCKGELILVIDADSYLYKDAIKKLVYPFTDESIDFTIGDIRIGNTESLVGLIQYYEYIYGFDVYKKYQSMTNSIYIMSGAFSLFKKSLIKKIGYWDNYTVVEDVDFSLKMRGIGTKGVYISDAIEITEGPVNVKQLLNQRIRWRRGFLDSLFVNRKIIFNNKLNKYLSFVELPLLLISMIEQYFYPILFIVNFYLLFTSTNKTIPVVFISIYIILYFIVITPKAIELKSLKIILLIPFIPIMFQFMAILEFYALLVTTKKIIFKQKNTWDKLQRVGLK